jgi:formylglycine-generating enzyme required for sulfatase activity
MKEVKRVYRVLRGGSWGDYPRDCRSADRYWYFPDKRGNDYGFRVVCVPKALLDKRRIDERG